MNNNHKKGKRGIANKNSKLTDEIVSKIRSQYKEGLKIRELAHVYKISLAQVGRIIRGEAWKHV